MNPDKFKHPTVKYKRKKHKLKTKTITKHPAKYEKGILVTPRKKIVEKKVSYPGTTKKEKIKVVTYSGMTQQDMAKNATNLRAQGAEAYNLFRTSIPLHTTEGLE